VFRKQIIKQKKNIKKFKKKKNSEISLELKIFTEKSMKL